MNFRFLVLTFFVGTLSLSAQKAKLEYKPRNMDSLRSYIDKITEKKAASFTGEHQKAIRKIIAERKTAFMKSVTDSSFVFEKNINNYLKTILKEIYVANNQLQPTDFYFFVERSPIPNAACYGNGIFTVNLGLLELVQSDDELAYILCHELAHYELKHNDKSLVDHVTTINSRQTKQKVREIKQMRYGKRKAAYDLYKKLSYNFLKRSRNAEMQADSLGYVLFSKTKYKPAAAFQSMKRLQESDSLLFTTDTRIRSHLNFAGYPFKEGWVTPDETLFDIKEKVDDLAFEKDSLRTHPDMDLRIAQLQKLFGEHQTGDVASAKILELKNVISSSLITSSLDGNNMDLALYHTLALKENDAIEQRTFNNTVAYLLKKTYELKQTHALGKYVEPVSPFSDEKYLNEVRLFINNIDLKHLRKVGYFFCQTHSSEMEGDSEFAEYLSFFEKLNLKN